jgi:hypothetical protein
MLCSVTLRECALTSFCWAWTLMHNVVCSFRFLIYSSYIFFDEFFIEFQMVEIINF